MIYYFKGWVIEESRVGFIVSPRMDTASDISVSFQVFTEAIAYINGHTKYGKKS